MNASLNQDLLVIAIETSTLLVIGLLAYRYTRTTAWRKTIWQLVFVALIGISLSEFSGIGRGIVSCLSNRNPQVQLPANTTPISPASHNWTVSQSIPATVENNVESKSVLYWIELIWMAGTAVVLLRIVISQSLFQLLRFRDKNERNASLAQRITSVAERFKFQKPVRVINLSRINAPIAFGTFVPTIGLPEDFSQRFSPVQQEAMLAHEMAHLAGHDPLWYLASDLVCACYWWNPLVWIARRQFHFSCEFQADEATSLIENGPDALAECLVAMGRNLVEKQRWAWIGADGGGFHSQLGKRVERLLDTTSQPVNVRSNPNLIPLKPFLCIVVTGGLILATGWMAGGKVQGSTWQETLEHSWNLSPSGLILAAASTPLPTTNTTPKSASISIRRINSDINDQGWIIRLTSQCDALSTNLTRYAESNGIHLTATSLKGRLEQYFKHTELKITQITFAASTNIVSVDFRVHMKDAAPLWPILMAMGDIAGIKNQETNLISNITTSSSQSSTLTNTIGPLYSQTFMINKAKLPKSLSEYARYTGQTFTSTDIKEQLRQVLNAEGFHSNNIPGISYIYHDTLGQLNVTGTKNDIRIVKNTLSSKLKVEIYNPQLVIQAKFIEVPTQDDPELKELVSATKLSFKPLSQLKAETNQIETAFYTILPNADFQGFLKYIENRRGVEMLAAPSITTLSGRQAHIAIGDKQSDGQSYGPSCDFIPTVSQDQKMIDLTSIAQVVETNGTRVLMTKQAVPNGNTLIMYGLCKKGSPLKNNALLVAVTCTEIDPAGNPIEQE